MGTKLFRAVALQEPSEFDTPGIGPINLKLGVFN